MKNIFDNAKVSENAKVSGNAKVAGYGRVSQTSDYITLGPDKFADLFTTAHKDAEIGVRVNCGCFSGTVDEFLTAIEITHAENPEYLRQYRLFHAVIVDHFNL